MAINSALQFLSLLRAFFGRGISAAGTFILTIVVSRFLDPESAGNFFVVQTIANIIAIFARFGLDIHLMKVVGTLSDETPQYSIRRYFGYSAWPFLFSLIVSAIGCGAMLTAFWLNLEAPNSTMLLFWLPAIPLCLSNMNAAFYKGRYKPAMGGLMEGGIFAIPTVAVLVLDQGHIFQSELSIWLLYSAVCWIVFVVNTARLVGSSSNWSTGTIEARAYLTGATLYNARFVALNQIVGYVSQWAGVVVVALYLGNRDAGVLTVLLRLAIPIQFIKLTLDHFFAPYFSTAFARNNPASLRQLLVRSEIVGLVLSSPIFVVMFFFPEPLIKFLFGNEYADDGNLVRIFAAAFLAIVATGANGMLLNMVNKDRYVLMSTIVNGGSALILYIVLISLFGLTGAAMASVMPLAIKSLFQALLARRALRAIQDANMSG